MKGRDIDNPEYDIATGAKIQDERKYFLFNGVPREFLYSIFGSPIIKKIE